MNTVERLGTLRTYTSGTYQPRGVKNHLGFNLKSSLIPKSKYIMMLTNDPIP